MEFVINSLTSDKLTIKTLIASLEKNGKKPLIWYNRISEIDRAIEILRKSQKNNEQKDFVKMN